jgi:hypothetical protein
MHCVLEDHFELYEFPNDLARWCWEALGDRLLGEQLGLIDPYRHASMAALRATLIDVIEERLWGSERVAWCRPGLELYLLDSRLVAYDTGQSFATPVAMAEAVDRISLYSLYFHVHEGRRRTAGRTDDFSEWLANYGADPKLVEDLRKLDFYALNLSQLRLAIQEVFRRHMTLEPILQKAPS